MRMRGAPGLLVVEFGGGAERTLKQAGGIWREELGRAEAMIQNLDAHLPAMRVAGKHQLDAEFRCARKRIGIVRKENVGHITAHQGVRVHEHDETAATGAAGELVIDADEIELRAAPTDLRVLLPEKFHTVLGEKLGGQMLSVRINLMISVATPHAQGRAEAGEFADASLEGIIWTGDEVSGDDGKIRLEFIDHAHGAAHVRGGHVTTDVNIAELGDAQTVKRLRQSADRQFDFSNAIIVPADEETVGARSEGNGSRQCGRALDKPAAIEANAVSYGAGLGLSRGRLGSRPGPLWRAGKKPPGVPCSQIYPGDQADHGPGSKRSGNPQTDDAHHSGKAPDQIAAPRKENRRQRHSDHTDHTDRKSARNWAQGRGSNSRGETPKARKPIALRQ